MLLAVLLAGALLLVAAVATAAGVIVAVTRGMPSLTSLQQRSLPQTTLIFDKDGHAIARLHGPIDRLSVASGRIPGAMKAATVAAEDQRFYQHRGVDFEALAGAAFGDLMAGSMVRGGSTITQQYVKNAYLAGETGLRRKIREAVLAWQLENRWSKDQILTAYLNTVYYGCGAYGVEAAARVYFHRDVSRLTLAQCALLAALPRFPSGYCPVYEPQAARMRRDVVLRQMEAQRHITALEAAVASRSPLDVYDRPPPQQCGPAAYFVQYVTDQLVRRCGAQQAFEGGLRVYTSLDMRMQRAGIKALRSTLPPNGPAGALVSVESGTGCIRAMVASTDWRENKFNLAWQSQRQLGSAMKPFALTAVILEGANPATTRYVSMPLEINLGARAVPPYWSVRTFSNRYAGTINLVDATWQSDNTVYAQLAMDLGPKKIAAVARRLGIVSPLHAYPSIVLGTEAVNPLEVAGAYATFAGGGVRHRVRSIEKIVFPDGEVVCPADRSRRVLPEGVAYVVAKILEGNTRHGTAAALKKYYSGVAAGKTGTTTNSADAWFCGFNTRLATAIWMGYPQAAIPMPGVQGATYCVPIWGKYSAMVFGKRAVVDFARPAHMPKWRPWKGARVAGNQWSPGVIGAGT